GKAWTLLESPYTFIPPDVSPRDFRGSGLVAGLIVPSDMEPLEIGGQLAKWMRVRLLSGSYGFRKTIQVGDATFSFVVPQPPSVANFLLGYVWLQGPLNAQYVLTFNDFRFEDQTAASRLPGETFQAYKPVSDRTPALYLGFDKKLPEDRLAFLFNLRE